MYRFVINKVVMISLGVLVFVVIFFLIGLILLFISYNYYFNDLFNVNVVLSVEYWFGMDEFGCDVWVRMWVGVCVFFIVGFVVVLIDFVIGVIYGVIMGFYGGCVDGIMNKFFEIFYFLFYMFVVILLFVVLELSFMMIIIVFIIIGWISMFWIVCGEIM